jgi:hypothetical protein
LEAARAKHKGDASSVETLERLTQLKLDLLKQLSRNKTVAALGVFRGEEFVTALEREAAELQLQATRKEQKLTDVVRSQLVRVNEGFLERTKDSHMLQLELDDLEHADIS